SAADSLSTSCRQHRGGPLGTQAHAPRTDSYTAPAGPAGPARSGRHMNPLKAFNLQQWIEQHRGFLEPPGGTRRVFPHSEFIIMVVGGPNARSDYHEDPGEEFFYQLEGTMTLRTM